MPATTECHISVRSQNEKFLSTFFKKLQGSRGQRPRSPVATGETPAGRSQRNTRAAHGAKYPVVPKRHPQMAQPPRQCRKAAVPTPTRVADGGLFDPPTVGRGILDAPKPHPIRGRQGCRPLRRWWSAVQHSGGGKPPPYGVEPIGPRKPERACQRWDTQVPPYVPYRQSVRVRRAAPMCAAVPHRMTAGSAWWRTRNRFVGRGILDAPYNGAPLSAPPWVADFFLPPP